MIGPFRGEYYFLSNMFPCRIVIGGIEYSCAEAAFQAMKLANAEDRKMFVGLNGYEAKKLGRRVQLRPDWNTYRLAAMNSVISNKFFQNGYLAKKLLETGDEKLVEVNTWNDTFWGVCNGKGQNWLGRLLMELREVLEGIRNATP